VQIFTHVLRDRIEWDLASPLPPSEFARHYCAELGLTGEAIPIVAHAIHEELLKHKRDALELDLFHHTHPLEQAKWERGQVPRTTNRYGARKLVGVWREWFERDEFSPILVELSMEEMEKREQERSRESRRMMRTLGPKRRR
jgi:chromatin structure-remodeling complex subunit SFH1